MNWNRALSALLAVFFIVFGYLDAGAKDAWEAGLFVILPLACIWFCDAMGGYIGPVWRGNITAASPGVVICILGWILLLMPFIMWIESMVAGPKP
jgi:hypothetical protein